jgi:hypothetical protein
MIRPKVIQRMGLLRELRLRIFPMIGCALIVVQANQNSKNFTKIVCFKLNDANNSLTQGVVDFNFPRQP